MDNKAVSIDKIFGLTAKHDSSNLKKCQMIIGAEILRTKILKKIYNRNSLYEMP